ncbi:hypothetical protein BH11BAC6_BH11BAC6_11640 [soil metagenome]
MLQQYKRLAIISDCIHTKDEAGNVLTENHIFRRQMEALAKHFEHITIVCPFINKPANSVTTAYTLSSIEFIATPNAGGNTIKDKWLLFKTIPTWVRSFSKAHKTADIFYLRMPGNIAIPAFFYFYLKASKTFATYTGTWKNYKGEPLTYRFQKWLLKHFFKGAVFAYIHESEQRNNLFKTFSPSYSITEWNEETMQVSERIECYNSTLVRPVFITVGALVPNKNQSYILEVCRVLALAGFSFYWYIVGDGYMKAAHAAFIAKHNLHAFVNMTGKKTAEELRKLYRASDFVVQATLIEGFGKAPVEAMFHGVIPILSCTAMAEEMTGNGARGYIFDASNVENLLAIIMNIKKERNRFGSMIEDAREYVKIQSLENWSNGIMQVINTKYN